MNVAPGSVEVVCLDSYLLQGTINHAARDSVI